MKLPSTTMTFGLLIVTICLSSTAISLSLGDAQLVYQWSSLDIDWTSDAEREKALNDGTFQPEKNLIAGIKVFNNSVYVTVPRWRSLVGFPLTLATVVQVQGQAKLRLYPDWRSQRVGDCKALQYVQSMEIDPNTGRMYVLDTGRIGLTSSAVTPRNLCPAKLVVYDLRTGSQIALWEFPDNVVSRSANFINDLVLDYVMGEVKFAYITDVSTGQMHVFDFTTNSSYNVVDRASMSHDRGNGSIIHINGIEYTFEAGLDGIAMSPNFDFVYYCPLGSYSLYSIPTSSLRQKGTTLGIRLVGRKISQSDGLALSNKRLYYGALGLNAVYSWDPEVDVRKQGASISTVSMETQTELVKDDVQMQWLDTFAIDEQGWLWFVSNRLHRFSQELMDFSGAEVNMRIWRVFINESSYLQNAQHNTSGTGDIVG